MQMEWMVRSRWEGGLEDIPDNNAPPDTRIGSKRERRSLGAIDLILEERERPERAEKETMRWAEEAKQAN